MTEGSAGLVSDTVISRGLDGPNEVPQNSELTPSVKSSEDAAWLREQVKVARDEINKVRCKNTYTPLNLTYTIDQLFAPPFLF